MEKGCDPSDYVTYVIAMPVADCLVVAFLLVTLLCLDVIGEPATIGFLVCDRLLLKSRESEEICVFLV